MNAHERVMAILLFMERNKTSFLILFFVLGITTVILWNNSDKDICFNRVHCNARLIKKDVQINHRAHYITIWDCGQYGHIMVDNEEVFRLSTNFNEDLVLFQNKEGKYYRAEIKR